jgi:aminopeptidase N
MNSFFKWALLSATSIFSFELNAQRACAVSKNNPVTHTQAVPISHVVLMNKYDMKFQHLNLNLERTGKAVSGNVRSIAQVKSTILDTFGLELYSDLIIDSARVNGVLITPIRNSHAVSFILPNTLQQNDFIDATIYYRGTAPTLNGSAIGDGLNNGTSQSWGNQVTWSLSEPYSAYEWFPCKQQLQDKIDSVYVYVTTDATNKVGSNGLLTAVVNVGNKKRYEWKSRHVIDYYLISVAIAKYVDYSIYAHPAGMSGDSILIQNYVYDNPATLTNFKSVIDQTDDLIEFFSDKFGLYPFADEKYGHAMAPFSGGMEHQTMSSMGFFNFELVAHELGHQWWGDNVTCKTWNDIFINEGFASYCEHLALEQFNPTSAVSTMLQVHNNVMTQNGGSVYNPDTVNVNRIFSSRLSYDKGSAIVHSLRFVINDDNLFFTALKNFQVQFANSTASILDFKSSVENTTGLNLTQFFNQWIFGEGYPTFTVRWNQVGSNFYLKNTETVSMSSITPLFITPLEFRLTRSTGDTIIKVFQDALVKDYSFNINGTISNVTTDPNNWILNKGTVTRDLNLVSIKENISTATFISLYPNPAKNTLNIKNTISSASNNYDYSIYDVSGKLILYGTTTQTIDISKISNGMYFIQIKNEQGEMLKTAKFICINE